MLILVDAMGGDNAPHEIVNGCIDAINEQDGFDIMLIGDKEKIGRTIKERKFESSRLIIKHTTEIITNEDSPTKAIKNKKDSSMVAGFNFIKENKGDVFLSAGNTGALMAGSLFILGRIDGVDRPALASYMPTKTGMVLLVDAGANTNCKTVNLLQFGVMGSILMSEVFKIKSPRVALLNIGAEEKKGNETIRNAYSMLSSSNINFIGNIEGRQILEGAADVIVCDGFVGNVLLKFLEGVGAFFFDALKDIYSKNFISKVSGLAIKKDFKNFKKALDYTEYGGVPLLGVDGKVIKSHGSSNAKAIKSALIRARDYVNSTVVEQIREEFKNMEVDEID